MRHVIALIWPRWAFFAIGLIDYIIFATVFCYSQRLALSMIAGRTIAIAVSIYLNKPTPFPGRNAVFFTITQRIIIGILFGLFSYVCILSIHTTLQFSVLTSKAIIESLLLFITFMRVRSLASAGATNSKTETTPTDWNTYYSTPYKSAKYSRLIISKRLRSLMDRYAPTSQGFTVAELGGANSYHFDMIYQTYHPKAYHLYDNNAVGLAKFSERMGFIEEVTIHNTSILELPPNPRDPFDMVLSFGLIEHFDPDNTRRAIASHFNLSKPSGIVIISFPTPTLLYNVTRWTAELLGMWIFLDERPLQAEEVAATVKDHGTILYQRILWPIFLTQYFLVARKYDRQ